MSELQTKMVDVGSKADTTRAAVARGVVRMLPTTARRIVAGEIPKGDVLNTARVAGIMAAKNTPHIVPLCHPLLITAVDVDLDVNVECGEVIITARVRCVGKTGVEMEALTAVSAAALTVYDMCKVVQKDMVIADVRLLEKSGGKSGDWKADDA
ncbi:MAG: cyclic pyranopterin monophosphate synthase MoaC [Abditibacteriales bacterium]|nr:cyclic pyranopterin monophosphate synthase MoaC [Abditibacteriales bacterium]MDW8366282.1 cyclic pyranopterin monophosphate synthase MoaC [Abditibacteriales bacterium]